MDLARVLWVFESDTLAAMERDAGVFLQAMGKRDTPADLLEGARTVQSDVQAHIAWRAENGR